MATVVLDREWLRRLLSRLLSTAQRSPPATAAYWRGPDSLLRMDAAIAAAWAGVAVAFLATAVSYYQARQNRRAIAAAERQAAVAEAALPPPPPPVGWEIRPGGEGRWAMVNIGTAVADKVEIDSQRARSVIRAESGSGPIRPGASIPLRSAAAFGDPTLREIWVRWEGQPEWIAVPLPPGWN